MVVNARVLIAEDEVRLAAALRRALTAADFDVEIVHDGLSAVAQAMEGDFDLLLLDLMLPGLSGYRVIERLRSSGNSVPVIMLTAKDGEYDEADAFDLGVDDYLTKPFSTVVLLARIRSVLRRSTLQSSMAEIHVGDLTIQTRQHRCFVSGAEVLLTAREFATLVYLAERCGEVMSKMRLLDEVWDDPDLDPNAVEVCIRQLRIKIGTHRIETVRGVGYRLRSS